ncbi:uncharacterized protein YuzE [Catenulispora sp. GP43]|uniref:DUF2283 domain-containing protein n=1 Tax=Catenulispora sp. GP43 TaxID=3156263 RepID=UPI0035154791
MRVTFDTTVGMAYIYIDDATAPGAAVRQVTVDDDTGAVLDFDADGRLLGIELPIERVHPDLSAMAEQIG